MFSAYIAESDDVKLAVRHMCRKLDLYWNENLFSDVNRLNASRNTFVGYLSKINSPKHAGKSYDDTLREEGTIWDFGDKKNDAKDGKVIIDPADEDEIIVRTDSIEITPEIIDFWGPGYSQSMYSELERRKRYWLDNLPKGVEVTIGLEALLRQICSLEIDINKARQANVSTEKLQSTLNSLLGSAMLKPAQGGDTNDAALEKTPFGVWIKRWENQRPVPEPDPALKDVDGLVKYILTWFYGHAMKMLGQKTPESKLYDEAMDRMRVENPAFEDDDDDDFLYDVLSGEESGGDE